MQAFLNTDPNLMFFAGRAALLVIAFLGFAIAFGRWRRAGSRDMQEVLLQLDASRSETRGLAELTAGLAAQLATLQQQLEDRAQLAQAAVSSPHSGGIDLATRLARQGNSVDEIVKTCGVTRHEAQLLARLHSAELHRQPDQEIRTQ
ncbi:MAG: DUF2802 domain-containing protein [Steroidobacteraceae bacterium]